MEHESERRECARMMLDYLKSKGYKIKPYMPVNFPKTLWMMLLLCLHIDQIKYDFMSKEDEKIHIGMLERAFDESREEFNSIFQQHLVGTAEGKGRPKRFPHLLLTPDEEDEFFNEDGSLRE